MKDENLKLQLVGLRAELAKEQSLLGQFGGSPINAMKLDVQIRAIESLLINYQGINEIYT